MELDGEITPTRAPYLRALGLMTLEVILKDESMGTTPIRVLDLIKFLRYIKVKL